MDRTRLQGNLSPKHTIYDTSANVPVPVCRGDRKLNRPKGEEDTRIQIKLMATSRNTGDCLISGTLAAQIRPTRNSKGLVPIVNLRNNSQPRGGWRFAPFNKLMIFLHPQTSAPVTIRDPPIQIHMMGNMHLLLTKLCRGTA